MPYKNRDKQLTYMRNYQEKLKKAKEERERFIKQYQGIVLNPNLSTNEKAAKVIELFGTMEPDKAEEEEKYQAQFKREVEILSQTMLSTPNFPEPEAKCKITLTHGKKRE